jgi:hypothetical protein
MNRNIVLMHRFPPEVTEKIGYYVYALKAPGSKKPFYIGKGKGNRVFAHAKAAIRTNDVGAKLEKIRNILASHKKVEYQIIRHGLTEKEAYEIESTLIDYLGLDLLSNRVAGHEMNDRGLMTVSEILSQYRASPARIKELALLIIINRLYRRNMTAKQLYRITRGDWVLGRRRQKADYGFAVYHGIILATYRIRSWVPVIVQASGGRVKTRWQFRGSVAPELSHYVGKSVKLHLKKGSQSPVLYLNC